MGCFITEISNVVVVRVILINIHIKFLTQTSIGLALLMDMVSTITLVIDIRVRRGLHIFTIFFNKLTYSKFLSRT